MTAHGPQASDGAALLEDARARARTLPLADARHLFRKAERAFLEADCPADAAGVLVEEARYLSASFDPRRIAAAHGAIDRAERLLERAPTPAVHAHGLHVRGYAFLRGGATDRAIEALQAAERRFRRIGDAAGEGRVLDTLGVLYERGADRERAALLLARSHALKQSVGDREGMAITLGNLGRLALHGGQAAEAEAFFELDLDLARSLGDRRGEGVILANLAECRLARGDTAGAERFATQVLDLSRALDDPVTEGYALAALASAAREAGRLEEALAHADASEARFREAHMLAGQAHARLTRARVLATGGEDRAAAAAALGAARAARHTGAHDVAVESLLAAECWLARVGAFASARRCLQRAQETALAVGAPDMIEQVRRRQVGHAVARASGGGEILLQIDAAAPALAAHVGRKLRLELDGYLGEGSFAIVLRVRDRATGAIFALKRLHASQERLHIVEKRLAREFTALARVDAGAPVVHPLALGSEDGQACLLMEYVAARDRHRSLADLMEDLGRLPPRMAAPLACDIVRGLQAIHAAGLVHRDVKPANVLLDARGRGVLSDYGLVYDVEAEAYIPAAGFTGTLGYAAPETLALGSGDWDAPTPAADYYGLGVTLYQALTGTLPFPRSGTLPEVIRQRIQGEPDLQPLSSLPAELRQLIAGLLERDPLDRVQDGAAVLAALAPYDRPAPNES